MTTRNRRRAEFAVFGVLLGAALLSARTTILDARGPDQDMGIPIGEEAPSAVVERLDGTKVDLKSYYGKQPVLIEFWATWCPNCKGLEPALKAAHQKYGAQVKFVGVAVTVNQSVARVKQYMDQFKPPLEMHWDAEGKAVEMYEVPATSYVVIVDKMGKIAYGGVGKDQKLEEAIRRVLGGGAH